MWSCWGRWASYSASSPFLTVFRWCRPSPSPDLATLTSIWNADSLSHPVGIMKDSREENQEIVLDTPRRSAALVIVLVKALVTSPNERCQWFLGLQSKARHVEGRLPSRSAFRDEFPGLTLVAEKRTSFDHSLSCMTSQQQLPPHASCGEEAAGYGL